VTSMKREKSKKLKTKYRKNIQYQIPKILKYTKN